MNVNRRQFLRRSVIATVGAGLGTGYYAWRLEPHWVEVVQRPMPLGGLSSALTGKRLAQISDLHVGPQVELGYLRRCIEQTVSLNPDLVVITGDLMTCRRDEQIPAVVELLRHLRPDSQPVFASFGNHEYGPLWRLGGVADKLQRQLSDIGIRTLRNELVEYEGLQIVGTDDLLAGRFDPATALTEFRHGHDGVMLSHNPDTADSPGWSGFTGWILAGHTHGGQCRLPGLPPPVLPIRNKRYAAGEIPLYDGRRLYVNRGLGYYHRVRFLAPPEITLFELIPRAIS